MVEIKNEYLTVKIEKKGAQLSSVISKSGIEYIWQKNIDKWWNRSAPILFPIVGMLIDDEYTYNGETYSMGRHGFLRNLNPDYIEEYSDKVRFIFYSNPETKKIYPFEYKVVLEYKLIENKLIHIWKVENMDACDMYYSIGGHPAFNIDKSNDIRLILGPKSKFSRYFLKGDYLGDIREEKDTEYTLNIDSFRNDAMIFDNLDYVKIINNNVVIKANLENMPLVGIWSQIVDDDMAPFICIEPWAGIADKVNSNKDIIDKYCINTLKSKEVGTHTFNLEFGE